jgi:putative PIN family toxin of toxin-antitoxin system
LADERLRVFIDSNVLFSGFLSPNGGPAQVLLAIRNNQFRVVLSRKVLEEVTRNLRAKVPAVLPAFLEWVERTEIELIRDGSDAASKQWHELGLEHDASIVASAIDAEVDYICTGDRRLREVVSRRVESPKVITPRHLVELLA